MDIPVSIVNQKLKIAMNYKTIVSGTKEFIRFVFGIPNGWEGLGLIAQFKQNNKVYRKALDTENSVFWPTDIGAGTCTLTLLGINSQKDVIGLTDYVTLTVKENDIEGDLAHNSNGLAESGAVLVMTDDGIGNVTIVVL